MVKFLKTSQVAKLLGVGCDQVLHLVKTKRVSARRIREKGCYLVHPVDVDRLKLVRQMSRDGQSLLRPDIVWVTCACRYLEKCVVDSGFEPQVVVGIAFGGVIPASLLSVFLRKPLCTIRAVHYSNQGRLPAPVVLESPGVFLDVPTLLVDDIADTGQTLEEVYEHLTSFGVRGENVRCSTLHRKPTSTFMPDWCVDVVVDGWVQYPWEEVDGNELLFRSGV